MKYYSLLSLVLLTPLLSACGLDEPMDHSISSSEVSHEMNHADVITDELSFISEMIPHHWEAVQTSNDMADETDESKDPVFFSLLTWIMETQRAEIAMMQWWYTKYLYPSCEEQKQTFDECQRISSYKPMYKSMMRDFSSETGSNRKVMYLTDMTVHHQGAIDMANKLLEIMNAQDPLIKLTEAGMNHRNEVKAFAQAIISDQTKEIEEMEGMLDSSN